MQITIDKEYKVTDTGTCYNKETEDEVIDVLESAYKNKDRVRIFIGDKSNGKEWCEEYDIMGTMSRSTGTIKIPLLINNARSYGGMGIISECILKITIDKEIVYQHKNYREPMFDIKDDGTVWRTDFDYKLQATFPSKEQAQCYIDFMLGKRNSK